MNDNNQGFNQNYGGVGSGVGPMGNGMINNGVGVVGGGGMSGMSQQAGQVPIGGAVAVRPPRKSILATIVLIVTSLMAVTFLGLFIYVFIEWNNLRTETDKRQAAAIETAVYNKTVALEAEFAEREKYPSKTFAGPADYGALTFEYPKTWSGYVARDASRGGEFQAYFTPDVVQAVGNDTVNALRFTIKEQDFDSVIKSFDSAIKSQKLKLEVRPVGGQNANIYKGEIPMNRRNGIIAVIRIRDKTVILQTDAMLFENDFNKILDSVKYNI